MNEKKVQISTESLNPKRCPDVYVANYILVAIPPAAVRVMATLLYRRGKWGLL